MQGVLWAKFRVFQEITVYVVSYVSLFNAIWVCAGTQECLITRFCWFRGEEYRLLGSAGLSSSLIVFFPDLCKLDELLSAFGNVSAPNLPLSLHHRDDP